MKKNEPFVDIIFSFENTPQQKDQKNITQTVLNNKELFFSVITASLSDKEKQTLVKISCCIYWAEKMNMDECTWYNENNGKFYDDEIPALMKGIYGIECTYEPINK